MHSQPVLLSISGTVVAFCRSLKLKTTIEALVRHPRRARKSTNERQVIPPNTRENLTVEMNGKYDRSVAEEINPNQPLPAVTDDTSNTSFDSETGRFRSLPEQAKPAVWGEKPNSATSGGYSGGKIIASVLNYAVPSRGETYDIPSAGPEQGVQRSRSPSPELLFTPLSPPPSHRRSRKVDAIMGPDDHRHLQMPMCSEHLCFPCSQCSRQQNEPLRFPF